MPAVLTIEALTQVAAVLVLDRAGAPLTARASLRGVDSAKFRRSVVPGDRLRLEVVLGRTRSRLARVHAAAYVDGRLSLRRNCCSPSSRVLRRSTRRHTSIPRRRLERAPSSVPTP